MFGFSTISWMLHNYSFDLNYLVNVLCNSSTDRLDFLLDSDLLMTNKIFPPPVLFVHSYRRCVLKEFSRFFDKLKSFLTLSFYFPTNEIYLVIFFPGATAMAEEIFYFDSRMKSSWLENFRFVFFATYFSRIRFSSV